MRSERATSADLLDEIEQSIADRRTARNLAIKREAKAIHKGDQRIGARIMRLDPAIRRRALAVLDAVGKDMQTLEACERLISGEGETVQEAAE